LKGFEERHVSVLDPSKSEAVKNPRIDSTAEIVESVLGRLADVRIAVVGDFCLDAYWELDTSCTETSVETGLPIRRVRAQRYQLGGAGNVVANLRALGVGAVRAVGAVGEDPFGRVVLDMLATLEVETQDLRCLPDAETPVYIKPLHDGVEANRIDLSSFRGPTDADIDTLVADLQNAASWADVLLINQQLPDSASDRLIDAVNLIAASAGSPIVVVDSRDASHRFRQVTVKCNHHEAERLCAALGLTATSDEERVLALSRHTGRPAFLTRGAEGILASSGPTIWDIPGIEVTGQLDPVGAGDTVLAAIGAALAGGATPSQAAVFANLAAALVVTKLHTTGTVSPAEAVSAASCVSYLYHAALAENPQRAQWSPSGGVEIISAPPSRPIIRHVVFDHDGTLSTLRAGWEELMADLMEGAILGDDAEAVSSDLLTQVRQGVQQVIRTTTGAPTIVQMEHLVALIRRFGFVPDSLIRTSEHYKAMYSRLLTAMVDDRISAITDGTEEPADYQIEGATRFLEMLSAKGVRLYLASGTDTAAVHADAIALGYADLFEGRISGASDDASHDAKRVVMDGIVADLPDGETFAAFGDGPVELREARRRGGIAVGVCSDERQRGAFNALKRPRLIRAGAEVLIADYSRPHEVLDMLGLR
jgi:rfaE bifunctional protein kinase chain/domain